MCYKSSVALTQTQNLLNRALNELPRGRPFGIEEIRALGVSSALASHYIKNGWLKRLERGVFTFPNDQLTRENTIIFLAGLFPGLHVGGKTALAWRGFRHNVAARESVVLWGVGRAVLPAWFTEEFPARYVTKALFSPDLEKGFGLQTVPESPDGPLVSVPERALLEMLSEVGLKEGVEEARNITEMLGNLRETVLGVLLGQCTQVKTVRLCVTWAEDLDLPWAAAARAAAAGKLGRGRWSGPMRNGTRLTLKP